MSLVEVRIPELGDAKGVTVVDVLVKKGSEIRVDDPLITLETEKASMDVPSPVSGIVESIELKKGDEVSAGTLIAKVQAADLSAKHHAHRPHRPAAAPSPAAPPPAAAVERPHRQGLQRRLRCHRRRRAPSIWWCWGPAWAATPPRFARPIWA